MGGKEKKNGFGDQPACATVLVVKTTFRFETS